LKNTREQLDIITAYQELGSYRAAAKLCGTTDKTVKQVVERQQKGELAYRTPPRPAHNTDSVRDLIHQRVAATDGRITAKRLLARARTTSYAGSARNFRMCHRRRPDCEVLSKVPGRRVGPVDSGDKPASFPRAHYFRSTSDIMGP
jgi:hypothetical protein